MGRAVAVALARAGVAGIVVAGRGTERAAVVADAVGGRLMAPDGLRDALEAVDVVVTATASPGYLLDRALCASVMARRPQRPLVIVDLALPRDVDPNIATLSGVTLVDLDDLRAAAAEALAGRRRHLPEVEHLVAAEVEKFLRETSAREIGPLVSALRCRVEDVRRAELQRWQARLGSLDPQALALAEAITAGVVAKLLHGPTVRLKDAAGSAEADVYRHALVELFDLRPTGSAAFARGETDVQGAREESEALAAPPECPAVGGSEATSTITFRRRPLRSSGSPRWRSSSTTRSTA
jgi:glutamyl-tRNA reductase